MVLFITNNMLLILVIMVFLAYIVINQLVRSLIQDKRYENAMLRTLGWRQVHIVVITVCKGIVYFVVPGTFIGVFVLFNLNQIIKQSIKEKLHINLVLEIDWRILCGSFVLASLLALISMAVPIYEQMAVELRNALDNLRSGVDNVKVVFSRVEE